MGRKKNKQKRNTTALTKGGNDESKINKEISCEQPSVSSGADHRAHIEKSSDTTESETTNNESVTGAEVVFETFHPNTERLMGREYFIHSLCQVCKEELNNKIVCPDCHSISYCSQDHRRQHWPDHADLCRAIVKVCAERHTDHIMKGSLNCSADDFRVFRFRNMVECETKVERPLENWEREMFIFPHVCGTCHKYDPRDLVTCDGCRHSGYCGDHRSESHSKWCKLLLLYKNIVKDQNKFGVVCPSVPNTKLASTPPKLQDMKQVFKGILKYVGFFEFIELTEITTYPFTVLNALLMRNKDRQLKQITLHVVGAETNFEINKPEKWEYYILHLIPELESLEIVFIGPELKLTSDQKSITVCSKCKCAKKSLTLKFQKDLYHVVSNNYSKPQMICAFNPGLYRTTGFNNEDTWSPSIRSMFAKDCPVLVTAYTHKEILLDVQRVKQTLNVSMDCEPMLNPFSSLKPNLNFVSDEESPVIFKNQYYCMMSKV